MKLSCLIMMLLLHLSMVKGQFTITNYNTSNSGLSHNNLFCITIDHENTLWLGANDYPEGTGGIIRFNGIEWDNFKLGPDTNTSHTNNISEILIGPYDDKWIFSNSMSGWRITKWDSTGYIDMTPGGIYGFDGLAFSQSIWFIDPWSGLYEYNYDSLKWIFYNNLPIDAPNNIAITAFNVDSSGTYWIGIANRNMYRWKDTILSMIKLFPEHQQEEYWISFNSTAYAKDGSVWFGTNQGLVHWFDRSNYITYTTSNSELPTNEIDKVIIDKRGYVWFTMYDWTNTNYPGLGFWDGRKFTFYNTDNSPIGDYRIRDIEEDHEGNIWIATWGGGVSKFTYEPVSADFYQSYQNTLNVFPNPVKTETEISIFNEDQSCFASFSLWSIDGVLIDHYELGNANDRCKIELEGISAGLYLGIATDSKGSQFTARIAVVD